MHKGLIALTGGTGFIGRYLLRELSNRGYRFRVLLRRPAALPAECPSAVVGDLARPQNMAAALAGVAAVIHSAGISHEASGLPEDDHRALNTEATIALARAAQRAGVRRFVFLSSIRAQSGPSAEEVLTEALDPKPTDAYGRTKLAAERGLAELSLDWVALRPVLVYGPGVRGNMARLIAVARSPMWLPLGSLEARRSLLSIDNLASAIALLLDVPGPLRRPLIVADPAPLRIPEMIGALRKGLGRPPRVFRVPVPMLGAALRAVGRPEIFERIARPLVAEPAALIGLGWTPRVTSAAGLEQLMRSGDVI